MLLSYCVVNTNDREHLLACLDAIERTHPSGVDAEVLVLDNASDDGSAAAVQARGEKMWNLDLRLIALERRQGKAANDSLLLQEASGLYALLLNEDTELQPGAARALLDALEGDPAAAVAGGQLLRADGTPVPCAWRLPGAATALAGAAFLHRPLTVQSGGAQTRSVGWVQSSAMLVDREAAEAIGWLDPGFFVYSDETDFCKRIRDAGLQVIFVPAARAIHHDQMASDAAGNERRIVEYHRGRDRYLRKHKGSVTAAVLRPLLAFPYVLRAAGAAVLPRHSPRVYLRHARQALSPGRGEGIREAAEAYNRRLGQGSSPG